MPSRAAIRRVQIQSPLTSSARTGGMRGTPMTSRLSVGPVGFTIGGGGGPNVLPFPGTPTLPGGFIPQPGGQVAPSAQSLLETGGLALCKQFFSAETCESIAGVVSDVVGGGTTPQSGGGGTGLVAPTSQCDPPFVMDPATGVCEFPGSPGAGSTPGGAPGPGQAVMGVFGAPAVQPQIVGEVTRKNGQQTLIRRCPGGTVLGKDNLCYAKGSIPNKLRKWPKAPRPPVSAYEAKLMRQYGPGGSKQKKIKKLAQSSGLTCKKR